MGTPEFPDLGKHCTVQHCKLIDFLPFTCDRCNQIYCLDHRSYTNHHCPKSDKKDIAVVVCPLCAKGVRLNPDEDPNITWEQHVNTDCDPSNYEKITKKKKCPVPGCREVLTFSNTIKCKDCSLDHCLKHRFGSDHRCAGPKKPDAPFSFMSAFSRKEASKPSQTPSSSSSSKWGSGFFTNVRASTEARMTKLGNEFNRAVQMAKDGIGQSSGGNGGTQIEECPQCGVKFASVTALVEHVEQVHEDRARNNGVVEVTIDVCPKCSREFHDPVSLVEHVERDHCGKSKA